KLSSNFKQQLTNLLKYKLLVTCLLSAFGLFVYQSLDSIDGKQARRTNTSSPWVRIFDHSWDSISTAFIALSGFRAMGLSDGAYWQTYVSGKLRFGKIDATEAQVMIIGIHLISIVFGPLTKLRYLEVRLMPLFFAFGIDLLLAVRYADVINNEGCIKIIALKSPENIFVKDVSLYFIAFSLVVTNKLVIAHMTKAKMEYVDWSLLGLGLLFLNQYFNCVVPEL
uniref:Uncharacterized protein n=1 Tax=Glossina morsitans morsitans TaxID=37546 RepID=A0A1B0FM64_GLOMM